MKFGFIETHRLEFAVKKMCQTLEVSTSGYYAWRRAENSKQKVDNQALLIKIKVAYKRSKKRYGSPRITRELREEGILCNEKRVARLMREAGIKAATQRKFKVTTNSKHDLPIAPNLVNQQFYAAGPNQLWLSDITYIHTKEGWLYLSAILDVFSRQIIGWHLSKRMTKELVISALQKALFTRKPAPGLVFHSDRGSQYASHEIRKMLENHQIKQSMSKKGDCYDNAMMESFFKTLKTELVYLEDPFKTRSEAKHSLFYFIEFFYNRIRKHSAIGYLSPIQFEEIQNAA